VHESENMKLNFPCPHLRQIFADL